MQVNSHKHVIRYLRDKADILGLARHYQVLAVPTLGHEFGTDWTQFISVI